VSVSNEIGRYAIVPLWLLEADTTAQAVRVYALLAAKYADRDTRECHPSHQTIGNDLGISSSTARSAIDELKEIGAVEVRHRFVGQEQTSNVTVIRQVNPLPTGEQTPADIPADPRCHSNNKPESITRINEPEEKQGKDSSLTAQFDEFYRMYPLKRGRGDAVRAWKGARKKASQEEILAGLSAYVRDVQKQRDGGFRDLSYQQPGPWLRAERWMDEYGIPTPQQAEADKAREKAKRKMDPEERAEAKRLGAYPYDQEPISGGSVEETTGENNDSRTNTGDR